MTQHAIILDQENSEIAKRIEEGYPGSYRINSTCFLVRTDDLTAKVAANVGIKGDKQIQDAVGVVLKLNGAYSGFASSSIWEWFAIEGEQ